MEMDHRINLQPSCRFALLVMVLAALSGCSSTPTQQSSSQPADRIVAEPQPPSQARHTIVQQAAKQVGSDYRLGGNSPREGFDCSGLVFYTHLQAGRMVPRRAEEQYQAAQKTRQVKPGDLLFFTTDSRGKRVDHVGIYIGNEKFIHAPGRGKSVTTASISEDYWQKRLVGAGSYID